MDSGNSGSMQSSSGGDEEYESRADSISGSFMNNPPGVGPMSNIFQTHVQLQHLPQIQSSSSTAIFDPLSNLFDPLSTRSNPLLNNLDMLWSRNSQLRSDHTPGDLIGGGMPNQTLTTQLSGHFSGGGSGVQNHQNIIVQPPPENSSLRGLNQTDQNQNVVRNSKKRPRASRRAPTTVLTTDTTNFRAMVQEFTGIPAPPFTAASSPFTRNSSSSRFDLFGGTTTTSAALSSPVQPQQPYLLRPFPQKAPFLSHPSSNFLTTNNNMQNPVFNIQNIFQTNPKYPPSNPGIKLQPGSSGLEIPHNDQNPKMGIFDDFGLSQIQPPATGETLSPSTRDNNINHNPPSGNWVGDGTNSSEQQGALNLRSGNGKPKYPSGTGNSSDFLGDKAADQNGTSRSAGMVESWICSSD